VPHFAILGDEFIQQFTHEARVLLCPRLVKLVAPGCQIKKHCRGGLQVEYCQFQFFSAIRFFMYEDKAKIPPRRMKRRMQTPALPTQIFLLRKECMRRRSWRL
jgi:hypothetical protein